MTLLSDRATPDFTWGEYLRHSCKLIDTQHGVALYTDANGFYIVCEGIVHTGYGTYCQNAFAEFVQRRKCFDFGIV